MRRTPLCVVTARLGVSGKDTASAQRQVLGRVESIERNNQPVMEAKEGEQVCVKIQPIATQPHVSGGMKLIASNSRHTWSPFDITEANSFVVIIGIGNTGS